MPFSASLALVALKIYLVLDPLGLIPYYLALTQHMSEGERRRVLTTAMIVVVAMLAAFSLTGPLVIEVLGFSLSSFKLAGGVLLFVLAIDMLSTVPRSKEVRSEDVAVFPIATPLLVGPGTLTVILTSLSEHGPLEVLAAALTAALAAYATLLLASIAVKVLKGSGVLALSRLMAVFLAAFAAEMVHEGLVGWGLVRS
ncbi:MAG TPA: MarC family protein [Thermofilaceae archaeon]|nr:MarC family protein [Thermofilaceae archaeon]